MKILIADDEAALREVLRDILVGEGHDVTEVADGFAGCEALKKTDFDLVIADMQMPKMSGIELLKWVKLNRPLPFMLITGFSNLFETKQAFDLGANDFVTKPFTKKDINEAVARAVAHDQQASEASKLYCKIPIEDFVSTTGFKVNVYARLSDTKFVRVAHKGDPIPVERVENYQNKGVHYLYAKKEEFAKVVGFNLELSNAITSSKSIPQAKKLRFLKYTSELVLEHCFVNGLDKEAFDQASECLNVCLSIISENETLFETLEVLNRHSNWLYAHSLGVSIYSVMIARKLGWKGQATLFKLAVAGLLHDIGSKELPPELLTKPRSQMSQEERSLYETHPTRGRDLLRDIGLPDDIIQIVHEHHEDGSGQGYPRRITKQKIHPLVRLVALADKFCYLVVKSPTADPITPDQAYAKIATQTAGDIDQKELLAFRSICVPTPGATAREA